MKKIKYVLVFVFLFFPIIKTEDFNFYDYYTYLDDSFLNQKEYLFVLNIPKIGLVQNIYSIDSIYNHVDLNVELLSDSSLEDNLFFLAGHSGNGDNCFFNHLVDLEYGDVIHLDFFNYVLYYEVEDIYYIVKNGTMDVEILSNTLYLVTCSLVYPYQQLVIKCKRII